MHDFQGKSILIVDDAELNRLILADYLGGLGFNTLLAADGTEAIQRAALAHPDLILLDVIMPGIDGFETCRRLKAASSTQDIPVIFMTALAETKDKVTGFEAGGSDYVVKGFELEEVAARIKLHLSLCAMRKQIESQNSELKAAILAQEKLHLQLLQSEKMASIGQLAAGVAHEINNPVGFVTSNLGTLGRYGLQLLELLDCYESLQKQWCAAPEVLETTRQARLRLDLDFLRSDMPSLINESQEGLRRVQRIVQNLKDFAQASQQPPDRLDLHACLENALNMTASALKHKARIIKEFGELPMIKGIAPQLSQVFLNLLINAAQAIEKSGAITLRSGRQGDQVWVEIADTGCGIPAANLKRVFDPFFTTRPVGSGTGLGLSVCHGIISQHGGRIELHSEVGRGSRFRVWLPVVPRVAGSLST